MSVHISGMERGVLFQMKVLFEIIRNIGEWEEKPFLDFAIWMTLYSLCQQNSYALAFQSKEGTNLVISYFTKKRLLFFKVQVSKRTFLGHFWDK